MPADDYKQFFREEWLTKKLPLSPFNANKPYGGNAQSKTAMAQKAIDAKTNTWAGNSRPKTRDKNVKILDDYLTLCEENNVRPIMIRVIVSEKYIKNFNPQLLDEFNILVEQACQKHHGACFFDGWKLEGFTYDDFYDHGHLNIHGAAKFSAYLNDFIEQIDNLSKV